MLGLKENWKQFSLLVVVNAFVGAMVGLERSILPSLAENIYGISAATGVLSFIAVFGITKAITNYAAGRYADALGRKRILVLGWLAAIPVPFLLMWAPAWSFVLLANVFLGISQGLTWSTTVIMKIDLVGPKQRGLAMGLNEFAGYLAVALSAWLTGYVATRFGLQPEPFFLGVAYVAAGAFLSIFFVRDTMKHVAYEQGSSESKLPQREVFALTTFKDRNLSSVTQAGLINNLNDGMAWGLFPVLFASSGLEIGTIAWLSALCPATWGLCQLFTGYFSDRVGRKWPIAAGMWVQALGIAIVARSISTSGFATGCILLGFGTALVYPTLLAAIGDVAHPSWRASAVGVYRFWRDMGYAIGALLSGVIADLLGVPFAIAVVAVLTFLSGVIVAVRYIPKSSKPR